MTRPLQSVDIFCTVIDNFGDIGVCWRLAQQLQQEHHLRVRLWIDDLNSFARLAPTLNIQLAEQHVNNIEIRHWHEHATDGISPYDVIIEGFGCRLPESFLQAMAVQSPQPVWLNLEYLSVENWTLDCHGLLSNHPTLHLQQCFYFPGFDLRSGGLLREKNLLQQRHAFQSSKELQQHFWQQLSYPQALDTDYRLSLFAYENDAVPALLTALSQQPKSSFVAVPEGRVLVKVSQWAGKTLKTGDFLTLGALTIAIIPFLSPTDYDRLLWACDLNMVRGEDSFIRAHWAARPLLWQIYPQEDDAHWVKLNAWLELLKTDIAELPAAYIDAQQAWNRGENSVAYWQQLLAICTEAQTSQQRFIANLSQQTDLASRLISLCTK